MPQRNAGFTVIELMVTVAIIGILAMVAAPSLRDVIRNARMTSLANDLMTDLSLARGEAVKRNVRISICTSNTTSQCSTAPYTGCVCTNTGWNQGWIVFTDGGPPEAGTYGEVDTTLTVDPPRVNRDEILKVAPAINGANETPPTLVTATNTLSATGKYVMFRPSGVTSPGGAPESTIDFYLCDSRRTGQVSASEALNKGRRITVLGTGRAQASRCTCDNSGALCTP